MFTLAGDAYKIGKTSCPQKLSHGNTLLAKIIQIGSNGVKIGHGSVSGIQTRARFLAVNISAQAARFHAIASGRFVRKICYLSLLHIDVKHLVLRNGISYAIAGGYVVY